MWYRGDCHVHSTFSDGQLTPEQLVTQALAAGLDFIAATEHNSASDPGVWSAAAGDDLLVILGEEVTTEQGHWLALGLEPGQVVDWHSKADSDVGQRLAEVHGVGGRAFAAHPHAPFPTGAFRYAYDGFDAVEVWNGLWVSDRPWQSDNQAALDDWERSLIAHLGRTQPGPAPQVHMRPWRPAVGGSDAHLDGQIGIPHTVVRADERTGPAILAGLAAGRCWIAQSQTIDLSMEASAGDRTAGIGDRLPTAGEPALVRIEVSGVPAATVSLHTDCGRVHEAVVPEHGTATVEWRTNAAESAYVRVEVRHPDRSMAALTNPVLFGADGA